MPSRTWATWHLDTLLVVTVNACTRVIWRVPSHVICKLDVPRTALVYTTGHVLFQVHLPTFIV